MLADDQRKNSGVGATVMLPLSGIDDHRRARQERVQLVELFARGRDQRAGGRMFLLRLAPRGDRIAAVQAAGEPGGILPASRASSRVAIASRRSTGSVMPSSRRSFCSKRSRPRRNVPWPSGECRSRDRST